MGFRNFSKKTETLALRWRRNVLTQEQWQWGNPVSDDPGQKVTESRPHHASLGSIKCLAKPGPLNKPRAAIEKIVSDLAYDLELPITPALLWDRGDGVDPQHVVLIKWAFDQVYTWTQADGHLTDQEKAKAAPIFSAMAVFETWISAVDRAAAKHVLINLEAKGATPRMAFIDYAYSLSHSWNNKKEHKKAPSALPLQFDPVAAKQVIENINELREDKIKEIVTRIPTSFLTKESCDIIMENLLSRRSNLEEMMKTGK